MTNDVLRYGARVMSGQREWLRRLRFASLIEGATLIALVCVAVPLKHFAGVPAATAVVGPIHGAAFLIYVWITISTVSGGEWRSGETTRLLVAAFIPFGALFNVRFLQAKERAAA